MNSILNFENIMNPSQPILLIHPVFEAITLKGDMEKAKQSKTILQLSEYEIHIRKKLKIANGF
jgi:hypothetical protein